MAVTKLNVHQRILAIMEAVSYIKKTDKKVNNQYTFVSHDDVTAMLHPLLVEHGLTCLTSVLDHSQEGNRTGVTISLLFTNVDDPRDSVTVFGFGHGIDPQDKGAGKALSYAVKSLLLKTFMLETGDKDNEAVSIDHKTEELPQALLEVLTIAAESGRDAFGAAWSVLDTKDREKVTTKQMADFKKMTEQKHAA